MHMCCSVFFFKQKTAYEWRISDWSSDVCSSDLLCGSRLGIEPDARLDDRADHRATVDARQRPRACDAELRALVAIEEHRRQLEIEQPEPGEGLQFGQIARNGSEQIGQRWSEIMDRPRQQTSEESRVGKGWVSTCRVWGLPYH